MVRRLTSNSAAPAHNVTQTAIANFLKSLQGEQVAGGQNRPVQGKLYPTLPDLLPATTVISTFASADNEQLDRLLAHLPPTLILLAQDADEVSSANPDQETVQALLMSMSKEQKMSILRKVFRSPQFHQSLGSLTLALRDGGLPTIAEALRVKVANDGYAERSGVPLGGGEAVEAFVNGVRSSVEDESSAGPTDTEQN